MKANKKNRQETVSVAALTLMIGLMLDTYYLDAEESRQLISQLAEVHLV